MQELRQDDQSRIEPIFLLPTTAMILCMRSGSTQIQNGLIYLILDSTAAEQSQRNLTQH